MLTPSTRMKSQMGCREIRTPPSISAHTGTTIPIVCTIWFMPNTPHVKKSTAMSFAPVVVVLCGGV